MTPATLRTLAALALGACLALPISTCTRYVDARGEAVELEPGEPVPPGVETIVDRQFPGEQLWTNPLGGVPISLAFLGPLGIRVAERRFRGAGARRALFLAEPVLLAAAAWYAWTLAHLGDPAVGFYVAGAALLVLAGSWLRDLAARRPGP